MLLIVAALALFLQDPPPGEVVSTAPPAAPAGTLADPVAPSPVARSVTPGSNYDAVFGRSPLAELAPVTSRTDDFDRELAASYERGAGAAPMASTPLPPEALADPVRYAAQQCRPELRPTSEGVAECFDRIERAVREEESRRAAARRPRTTCTHAEARDEDGRTSSTSGRCAWGTGDPALLDSLFDRP
ncbi:MAG TPA: hypothetical protein VGR32_06365 [Brevundimonas sp.]|jgi:hypothetical protein|uniref:hypothetical protein n=1 Tax=Brevundimonas sp. TaxID=1871086 RepID=UPI002DE99CAA|nr:hypothetical protein [Brevundimonas sp.]